MNEQVLIFSLNEEQNKTAVFTPFSLIHTLSGFYMALLFNYLGFNNLQGFLALNIVHFMYEVKDYYVTYHTEKGRTNPCHRNTLINSIGDQFSTILGAIIFYSMNKSRVETKTLVNSTLIFIIISILAWVIAWGYFKIG